MTPHRYGVSRSTAVSEWVEGNSSGYLVRVERLDTAAEPVLSEVGYGSGSVLYLVFGGETPLCDHDRHRLVRRHFAGDRWLLDELARLKDRLETLEEGADG